MPTGQQLPEDEFGGLLEVVNRMNDASQIRFLARVLTGRYRIITRQPGPSQLALAVAERKQAIPQPSSTP